MNDKLKAGTGVFSNREILSAIDSGQIICRPFSKTNLSLSSLDVCLGGWYYRTEQSRTSEVYNPFEKASVDRYFDGPHQAVSNREWTNQAGRHPFVGIDGDCPIIVLGPGERMLAHTQEFVGIRWGGTTMMKARSTWGRNGLAVCFDAGWGDPGYTNRWTMELYNLNSQHSIVLPVGEPIAQIVFLYTVPVDSEYSQTGGKYQSKADDTLDKLIANWRPQDMLPKAYVGRSQDANKTQSTIFRPGSHLNLGD